MGILKNRHGVHLVRKKVLNGLEEAVATRLQMRTQRSHVCSAGEGLGARSL
jgi:hypothetical protein